nr:GSU2403 family nucleotidyltransferase fold protein [Burkholderia ambifaria]
MKYKDFPYKIRNMENLRKPHILLDIGDDARRQYIDAESTFTAYESAVLNAASVRGGMYWKSQGEREYLIRTSSTNAQKSLGPRSDKTEGIYAKFTARKVEMEAQLSRLQLALEKHQRLNRALRVGRAPAIAVNVLAALERAGLAEHFTVVGTHALYAYEAMAGVRVESAALATQDVDLLWDTRKRVQFVSQMNILGSTMIGLLKKVDSTFTIRDNQRFTAVNADGFEVDIIRREASEGDPHPLRLTDDAEDFWAVQARRAGTLLSAPRFSAVIVTASGHMARMNTIAPAAFCEFKRWMADQTDRDPLKRQRDALQVEIVEQLMEEYLPQWLPAPPDDPEALGDEPSAPRQGR